MLQLVEAVVEDQRRRHDAHHEHAEVDQRGVLQEVERRVREHHLLDDVLEPLLDVVVAGGLRRLRRRRQDRAVEQVRHVIAHLPEEDADGALAGGGDLRPLEQPLEHGDVPAGEDEAVEAEDGVVAAEREAPDLRRVVGAGDAARVREERLAVEVGEDVVGGEVRVHLRRVAELELAARVVHHVADAVHLRVVGHLQVVVDVDGAAEALPLEHPALEHRRVRHHADALVHDVGLDLLPALEQHRLGLDLVDRLAEHQLGAALLEPREHVGVRRLVEAGQDLRRHVDEDHVLVRVHGEDLARELDPHRARADDDHRVRRLQLGGGGGPRRRAVGERRLRLQRLDRVGVRRAHRHHEVVVRHVPLGAVRVAHDHRLVVGAAHRAAQPLAVARRRQRAREVREERRLHEAAQHARGVLKVVLEVDERHAHVLPPRELALRRQPAERRADDHHVFGLVALASADQVVHKEEDGEHHVDERQHEPHKVDAQLNEDFSRAEGFVLHRPHIAVHCAQALDGLVVLAHPRF